MNVLETADRLRKAQERLDGAELERLIRAYAAINNAAADKAEALALKIAQIYEETGQVPTQAQIYRLQRYKDLMTTIREELDQYETYLKVELRSASGVSLAAGEKDARLLIEAALSDAGVSGYPLRALEPRQLEQLIGFLAPDGELYKRLGKLSDWTAEQVAEEIIRGVGLGQNPRTTARMLTKALADGITQKLGMGLTDALRTVRTVQLWSYREASRANYVANEDIVPGWVWYATLDADTCASCVVMHGTEHPNSETLDDHYNGRCSPLPMVLGRNPVTFTGKAYFETLRDSEKETLLGKGRFEAYQVGQFKFEELSKQEPNDVYGSMRVEAPLYEIVSKEWGDEHKRELTEDFTARMKTYRENSPKSGSPGASIDRFATIDPGGKGTGNVSDAAKDALDKSKK